MGIKLTNNGDSEGIHRLYLDVIYCNYNMESNFDNFHSFILCYVRARVNGSAML